MVALKLPSAATLAAEARRVELGDRRRSERLGRITEAIALEPGDTFPELMGSDSELEAFYRFVNNDSIDLQKVVASHFAATAERCRPQKTVLAIHDTSELLFSGETRTGLGRVKKGQQSLFAHVTLAVAPQEVRCPLGVLAIETWARTGPRKGRRSHRKLLLDPTRESLRWHRSVQATEKRLSAQDVEAIHLMDREGDAFALLGMMVKAKQRFVVRVAHDRSLVDDAKLYETIESGRVLLQRNVRLSARKPGRNPRERKFHPARSERVATLAISAMPVVLARSDSAPRTSPRELALNVVLVREINPPAGVEPIVWRLMTTEPIDTAESLSAIVDAYRSRWLIEEFFKALKTGCQIERRQLESRAAIEIALGIFLPIAWRLLLLRALARQAPQQRNTVLTPEQLAVLRECGRAPLGQRPTNRDVLMCLAALGGHIKNNGDPGWIVLGRAYEKLLLLEMGWRAGRARIEK